jgi:hypothetical protein
MNKALFFITIFSFGYVVNDILRERNINLISRVYAEVAGMDQFELKSDYDFKKAVRKVVERYCSVSDNYLSC